MEAAFVKYMILVSILIHQSAIYMYIVLINKTRKECSIHVTEEQIRRVFHDN